MKVTGTDEKDAFRRLQELAAERNQKLIDAAQSIVAMGKAFRPAERTDQSSFQSGVRAPHSAQPVCGFDLLGYVRMADRSTSSFEFTPASRPPADSQDLLSSPRRDLRFSAPKAVAVVGATETVGSVGRTLLWNLISTPFGGTVFPINPKRPSVLGIQAYPSLAALPVPADLAVIATPARSVPRVIEECVRTGVKVRL